MVKNAIGAVFTPLFWTKWVIEKYRLLEKWLDGAVVLDPTAGEGNFLEGFIALALEKGYKVKDLPLKRLYGIEKEAEFVADFHQKMREKYHIQFPKENFFASDIFFLEQEIEADILIGNPPWLNFTELPDDYKQQIKPLFHEYGLINGLQELLLGNARIDIATLIISKTLSKNLKTKGEAYFFMPLSILLNDGANKYFRTYKVNETEFCVREIYDFKNQSIFENVATRYGLVAFERDKSQYFTIPFFTFDNNNWVKYFAKPIFSANAPLSVMENEADYAILENFQKIHLPENTKPRQGVNTCGANEVYIFDECKEISPEWVVVSNANSRNVVLPKKFIYPLVTKGNFRDTPSFQSPKPQKWILMPYSALTGKPLEWEELQSYPSLCQYLCDYQHILSVRKGIMLNTWIKRGVWWALLGVGPYSFTNYKVVWESFGQKRFAPILLSGNWQGNQAIHAYLPLSEKHTAIRVCNELKNPHIELYLSSLRMEGTCNWAQPGKMRNLLHA